MASKSLTSAENEVEILSEEIGEGIIPNPRKDIKSVIPEQRGLGRGFNSARGVGRVGSGRGRGANIGNTRNSNAIPLVNGRDGTNAFDQGRPGKTYFGRGTGPNRNIDWQSLDRGERIAKYQETIGRNIQKKLDVFKGQPMIDLAPLDPNEKKFNGGSNLYVGGLTFNTTEKDLKEIFGEYGDIGEVTLRKEKMFAFVKMGNRLEAQKAKRELDGQTKNGRVLKVKFSPHQAAIKVSNLGPWVSNELLHAAFSVFGEIERCVVHADERGTSKEEGIVEFEKKGIAMEAVRRCSEGCFFLTTSFRPVYAELIQHTADDDGIQEKMLPKHSNEYSLERDNGPRFAKFGTFEYEYGTKWKALYELKQQKEDALKVEMKMEETKLLAQMEYSRFEHETEVLREELRKKEAARDTQKSLFQIKEKYMEDIMKQELEKQKSLEENIFNKMQTQTTRQAQEENSLFTQAQELSNMLDLQESLMGLGQNSGTLSNEGTIDQINALASALTANFGSGFGTGGDGLAKLGNNGQRDDDSNSYVDAEDLFLEGEMGNPAGKRRRAL